jgi:hypothetical protein
MTKLCPGGEVTIYTRTPDEYEEWHSMWGIRPSGVKRIRIKCSKCGRRIMSSVDLGIDADNVKHILPPHKPKMWWKKGKRRKVRR